MQNAQNPSVAQLIGGGLATGVGTAMNLQSAQQSNDFWNKYLNNQSGSGSMGLFNSANNGQGYGLNANLGMFNRGK